MTEEKVEAPQIETPTEAVVDDATELMAELKKLDIQTPTDIQNIVYASQETGKAWNEVGNLRKEVDRLTRMVETKAEPTNYDATGYEDSSTVDLGKVVETKVQGVLNRYLQGQQQAQRMAMQAMSEVKNDPEYGVVGSVFEQYVNSPEVLMKLQSGQTDYKTEWLNTKATYYRNLAQRSSKTLEGLMEKSSKAPPHMEQGDSQSMPTPQVDEGKREQFNKIKKAQREGRVDSNQALDDIVKSVMPGLEKDAAFFMP